MSKVIMMTSGKGGVGKTTLSAALGQSLSKRKRSVLLVDGDLGLRDLDLVLGVQDEVFFTSRDIWEKKCKFNEALVFINEHLHFLPASQTHRWEDVKRKRLGKTIKKVSKEYDYVIVDSPAGIGRGLESMLPWVDEVVIVVEPSWLALRDAQRVIQFLKQNGHRNYMVWINKVAESQEERTLTIYEIIDILGVDYLGAIVPANHEIGLAGHEGRLQDLFNDVSYYRLITPYIDMLENDNLWEIETVESLFNDFIKTDNKECISLENTNIVEEHHSVDIAKEKTEDIINSKTNKVMIKYLPSLSGKRLRANNAWKWSRGRRR